MRRQRLLFCFVFLNDSRERSCSWLLANDNDSSGTKWRLTFCSSGRAEAQRRQSSRKRSAHDPANPSSARRFRNDWWRQRTAWGSRHAATPLGCALPRVRIAPRATGTAQSPWYYKRKAQGKSKIIWRSFLPNFRNETRAPDNYLKLCDILK
jgi:hypothetical protein